MPRHSGSSIKKVLASSRTGIEKLQDLIQVGNNEATVGIVEEEAVAAVVELNKTNGDQIEYMDAGATIGAFASFCNSSIWRYNYNLSVQQKCEDNLDDINHAIEFHPLISACRGFTIYRKIRETRQERRRCKHENEVIQPIVEFFNTHPNLMSEMEKLHKTCDARKAFVAKFSYKIRGNVLQELGMAIEGQTTL